MDESRKKKKSEPVLPWMRQPVDLQQFEELSLDLVPCLDPRLKAALEKISIRSLFPVQVAVWSETIGPGAFERDLCINSPTGSGKTLAYALPMVQQLSSRKITCLRALIVLPTRDLALQVKKVFDAVAPDVGLKVGLAVGQSSVEEEISVLIKKPKLDVGMSFDPEEYRKEVQCSVDILVATPGRLMDHIRATKGFSLRHLCYLVVDETDRFLREEYQSWLPTVLRLACLDKVENCYNAGSNAVSTIGQLRTFRRSGVERGFKDKMSPRLVKLVLSATLTQDPSKLSQLVLHHPLFLTAGHKRYKLPETLETCTLLCESKTKPLCLIALLHSLRGEKCIVFTSSKKRTRRLTALLKFFGEQPFKFSQFWGQQHQSRRSKTLDSFRRGEIDVLISSDAIARGMDVEGVRNVINYDMAPYVKTYIHRAGRTARAGHSGRCFTILRKNEFKRFKEMLLKAGEAACEAYTLPADLMDKLRPLYDSALAKLKELDVETKGLKRKKDDEEGYGPSVDDA
ncbi:RNA helicase 1 [Wolffia australiana]